MSPPEVASQASSETLPPRLLGSPGFSPDDLELLSLAKGAGCPGFLESSAGLPASKAFPDHDLAVAQLFLALLDRPESLALLQKLQGGEGLLPSSVWKVGLVPGAFFKDHPHTGADGARVLQALADLGIECERIPIGSFDRVEENARIIQAWVSAQSAPRLAIVSLSKGTVEARTALASGGLDWSRVRAWISLSGLPLGTPLVQWFEARPLRRLGVHLLLALRSQSFRAAQDIRHTGSEPGPWPDLPGQLRLVHVVGFPLRRHLRHRWAADSVRRLAASGPSDGGGFPLADVARIPGLVCPLWGVDHYLDPTWDAAPLLRRLLAVILAEAEGAP